MPEVISDTSPLQYLHQLGCLSILPKLYGSIRVPEGVRDELSVGLVRGVSLPRVEALEWIEITPSRHHEVLPLATDLGRGEREVLSLAIENPKALVLLDDKLARQFAKHLHIACTGTLGLLLKAKALGHLDRVDPILDRLQSLNFRISPATRDLVLDMAGETRPHEPFLGR